MSDKNIENNAGAPEAPKKKNALPKYLSKDESISLLTSVAGDDDSKYRERNFCIITLFLNGGRRLSELFKKQERQNNLENGTVKRAEV